MLTDVLGNQHLIKVIEEPTRHYIADFFLPNSDKIAKNIYADVEYDRTLPFDYSELSIEGFKEVLGKQIEVRKDSRTNSISIRSQMRSSIFQNQSKM